MAISRATQNNWDRLLPDTENKLRRGANKSRSDKQFCPSEYLTDKRNIVFLSDFSKYCAANQISPRHAVFSLALNLLRKIGILHQPHVQSVLNEYDFPVNRDIEKWNIPDSERDLLGLVYQCLLPEGEKNSMGSYFTPEEIVKQMVRKVSLSREALFLDPCCGSGSYLLALSAGNPEQIWGCDKDPAAAFIAKINLLCKFKNKNFIPRIFCRDYLKDSDNLFPSKFRYIITNPPWGAEKNTAKRGGNDSFARFFMKAYEQLEDKGLISFLFPVSVLNVKSHRELRKILFTQCCLKNITVYDSLFTGVMTKYAAAECAKDSAPLFFELREKGKTFFFKNEDVMREKDYAVSVVHEDDAQIIEAVAKQKAFDLSDSVFALGIVTGDNANILKDGPGAGLEPVFTGKEIGRYRLKPPRKYLRYDRKSFQQTAKDEIYRAKEKLIYKFISAFPVVSYDSKQSLVLNSANIVIPRIDGMSVKTVLAFLNSDVLRYYYSSVFHDIKVLKGNLTRLPFPRISAEMNLRISESVDSFFAGDALKDTEIQNLIYQCFALSAEQIRHIRESLRKSNEKI